MQYRPPHLRLFLHLVWGTWDRSPLIAREFEPRLHAAMARIAREADCRPLAIGGVEDHVHVLVELSRTIEIAELVQRIKGGSSHFVNHEVVPDVVFRWQRLYGAFTVGERELPIVQRYVAAQRERHAKGRTIDAWELPPLPRPLITAGPDAE